MYYVGKIIKFQWLLIYLDLFECGIILRNLFSATTECQIWKSYLNIRFELTRIMSEKTFVIFLPI